MCGVIMFTAMGRGPSKKEAKRAALKPLLDKMATGAEENGLHVGTNSTIPEA